MAANISQLTDDYLFEARLAYPSDLPAQKASLIEKYLAAVAARDGGDAEVTNTTFKGNSSQAQFRGASPEDHRLALKSAIEQLENQIAGATAAAYTRPFGFRWTSAPAIVLDNAGGTPFTVSP